MHVTSIAGMLKTSYQRFPSSAAPWRRPRLDRMQTFFEILPNSPGSLDPPPARARAFRRATTRLPSDYCPTTIRLHPTDPFGTLGRSLAALGALLWRSWAISVARTSIFDRLSRPKSLEEGSEERFWSILARFLAFQDFDFGCFFVAFPLARADSREDDAIREKPQKTP